MAVFLLNFKVIINKSEKLKFSVYFNFQLFYKKINKSLLSKTFNLS